MSLRVFRAGEPATDDFLDGWRHRGASDFARAEPAVRRILARVRAEGDAALAAFAAEFEHRSLDPA